MYFQSSDGQVLWSSHHLFHLWALISVIRGLAIAALPWMLDLWRSHQTVFVETVFKMNIKFCCHLCCSTSMIYRHNPLQRTRSLSLSFGFQPLFLLADDVLPCFMYVIITLETAALGTPNKVAVLVTDAPAKCAPTIWPLWKSEKSTSLQYFHTYCDWSQSVMYWQWHYTAQTNNRIMKDTTNFLSVQPTQTVLFLYCLVFPLFVHTL